MCILLTAGPCPVESLTVALTAVAYLANIAYCLDTRGPPIQQEPT
jgi:hypothetical protein